LQHLRASESILRQESRAIGEVVQDRVGFSEQAAVVQFQQRYPAVGVLRQERAGPDFSLVDIERDIVVALPSRARISRTLYPLPEQGSS